MPPKNSPPAIPASRADTLIGLRIGRQSDPALMLRAAGLDQRERFHEDNLAKEAARAKEKAADQAIAKGNLIQRELAAITDRKLAEANLAKALLDRQKEANGTHDLTAFFFHLSEINPSDPDFYTLAHQLRLDYPQAVRLTNGNKAIEDAIAGAAPQQAIYKPLREAGVELAKYTERNKDRDFIKFNLKGAKDEADRIARERLAGFGPGASATLLSGGGMTIHAKRPERPDMAGLTPEQERSLRGHSEATKAELRGMIDGKLPIRAGMKAEIMRQRARTPSEQDQWIDDEINDDLTQRTETIKKQNNPTVAQNRANALGLLLKRKDEDISKLEEKDPSLPALKAERQALADEQTKATKDYLKATAPTTVTSGSPGAATVPAPAAPKPSRSMRDVIFGDTAPPIQGTAPVQSTEADTEAPPVRIEPTAQDDETEEDLPLIDEEEEMALKKPKKVDSAADNYLR